MQLDTSQLIALAMINVATENYKSFELFLQREGFNLEADKIKAMRIEHEKLRRSLQNLWNEEAKPCLK